MYTALITGTSSADSTNAATGLYIKDYSKVRLDYAYFGNEGLFYKSSNSVNLFLNPGAESYSGNTPVYWNIVGLGGTANTNYTQSIVNLSTSTDPYYYFDQGTVGWKIILGSSTNIQNGYAALPVDGSAAFAFRGVSSVVNSTPFKFKYYSYPTFNLANSVKTISSITNSTQNITITAISYTAATTTSPGFITYTATNTLIPGQKVTISGATSTQYNFGDAVVASASSTQFTVYANIVAGSTSSATGTSYLLTITTGSTAHNLRVGDLFYADAGAWDLDTTDYLALYYADSPGDLSTTYSASTEYKTIRVLSVTGYNTFTIQNSLNSAPNGTLTLIPGSQGSFTGTSDLALTVGTNRSIPVDSTAPFLQGDTIYWYSQTTGLYTSIGTITNVPSLTSLTVTISTAVTIKVGDIVTPAARLFKGYNHTFDLDSAKVRFGNNSYVSFKSIVSDTVALDWDNYRYTYVNTDVALTDSLSVNFINTNNQSEVEVSPYKIYQQYSNSYPAGIDTSSGFYFDLPLWTLKQNTSYDNTEIIYNNEILSIFIPTGTASATIYMKNTHNILVNDVVVLSNMSANASLGTLVNGIFTVSAIGVNSVTVTGFTSATAGTYSLTQGNIAAKFGPSGYTVGSGGQSLTVGTARTVTVGSTLGFSIYDPIYIAGTYVGYVTAITPTTTLTLTVTTAKTYVTGDSIVNYYDPSFGVILDQILLSNQSSYFDGDTAGAGYDWQFSQYSSASIKNSEPVIDVQSTGASLSSVNSLIFNPSYSKSLNENPSITTSDTLYSNSAIYYSSGNWGNINQVNLLNISSGSYQYVDVLKNITYLSETFSEHWVSKEGTGFEIISLKEDISGQNTYKSSLSLFIDSNNNSWFTAVSNKAVIVDDYGYNSFTTFPNDGTGFSNSTTTTALTTAYLNRYLVETTNQSTTSTTYTAGSPVCAFRFRTGVSGKVQVTVGALMQSTLDGSLSGISYEIYKGTSTSGTLTVAANDSKAFLNYNTQYIQGQFSTPISLSPNTTYYIRTMHRTSSASSAAVLATRFLTVLQIN
jgi:hypothetical protein